MVSKLQNVLVINTYAGSLLLGAVAAKVNIIATMEDSGYKSDLQELNFPKIPRYEKTEDWPEKFKAAAWRDIDVIAHPPCASFSTMAAAYKTQRGTDSDGFECHRRVINYALGHKCRSLAIESVIGAYDGGHTAYAELATKYGYRLTYIFLNSVSFGVPQWRPRVWVLFHHTKRFNVELKPNYVLLHKVLVPGPTPVNMLDKCMGKLYTDARKLLKGKHPVGHIYKVLRDRLGIESNMALRERFPEARGYVSGHIRFLDGNGFSTTILGNTALAYRDRLVTLEEYCSIMGFPRTYKFGRHQKLARTCLSQGVCPPVAAWIIKMMDRNASGWVGKATHSSSEFGEVIDLKPKKAEALAGAKLNA